MSGFVAYKAKAIEQFNRCGDVEADPDVKASCEPGFYTLLNFSDRWQSRHFADKVIREQCLLALLIFGG